MSVIVVTRYDRVRQDDGEIARIHEEDLCQALGVFPQVKYQREGGPSPTEIAGLLGRAAKDAEQAIEQFADALIWNWLIGGTDAHAKNYSLMLDGDRVIFAPLYDIASALPYGEHERKLRLAMKLGGDYRLNPHNNPWPKVARELGLDADTLLDRARELISMAPVAFTEAGSSPDVIELDSRLPSTLPGLVEERSARCLKLLD